MNRSIKLPIYTWLSSISMTSFACAVGNELISELLKVLSSWNIKSPAVGAATVGSGVTPVGVPVVAPPV